MPIDQFQQKGNNMKTPEQTQTNQECIEIAINEDKENYGLRGSTRNGNIRRKFATNLENVIVSKKLISLISAVALALPMNVIATKANANSQIPTVAILDTAINSSLPIFKDKIVFEVCILEWASCPNGQKFMEGAGSANLPLSILNNGQGFDHGTQMSSVAINTNPNIKIVFVRIIGNTLSGSRQTTGETGIALALKWILDNKSKFNIQSVVMSQANHGIVTTKTEYCPLTVPVRGVITSMLNSNLPVFFPAGNSRDYSRLSWPACINESISVGMADQYDEIDNMSNFDKNRLDFYATGNMQVVLPDGSVKNAAGSSISAQVAGAIWAGLKYKNPSLTYQETVDILSSTSKFIKGARGQSGKLIDRNISNTYGVSVPIVNTQTPTPAVKTPAQIAAEKALLIEQANKAIADAETQYKAELKASADKLAAVKLEWNKKING